MRRFGRSLYDRIQVQCCTHHLHTSSRTAMKIFLRKFWQTHLRSIVSSARSHKLLCGVDIHIITDSTYFRYSPWCVLPSQPPASTVLRKSVRQEVWPPDQALNTSILQGVYQKKLCKTLLLNVIATCVLQNRQWKGSWISFHHVVFFWGIDQTINSVQGVNV
jgi:hypothetical protein